MSSVQWLIHHMQNGSDEEIEMEPAPEHLLLDIYAFDINEEPDWFPGDLQLPNQDLFC